MAYITSSTHRVAVEELIVSMRVYIRHNGGIPVAAKKMKISDHDLAKVLRLDRTVSLSKLHEMGNVLGLELVMKWEPKNDRS